MSGTPVLSTIREGLAGARIVAVRGILNGTANHILTLMAKGFDCPAAPARCRSQGPYPGRRRIRPSHYTRPSDPSWNHRNDARRSTAGHPRRMSDQACRHYTFPAGAHEHRHALPAPGGARRAGGASTDRSIVPRRRRDERAYHRNGYRPASHHRWTWRRARAGWTGHVRRLGGHRTGDVRLYFIVVRPSKSSRLEP